MELLQVADSLAREKNIDRDIVIQAMEEAIQKAGRTKYGYDHDIRANIDRKSGELTLKRYREVCVEEEIENDAAQIPLEAAKRVKPDAEIGDFLVDSLPPLDYGRIAAQTAKQVIMQKVREAEREKQFDEYKDRVGEVINGVVKRVEYGNVTVDMGKAEALLRRDECLPREHVKNGDRIRAIIYDVRRETRGPQIFLSRTRPEMMAALFKQEVPEIYDGIIEIKACSRDPGSRAKIAVVSREGSIDPVGACVGMRGSRVQAIVNELGGEKIDIIPWTEDLGSLVIGALQPAEVSKVVLDEENGRIEVVVPDEQLSLAIGRRGQNVRLASGLLGWDIDILTEAQESERRANEFKTRSSLFMEALDVDDVIAHLLVAEGFTQIEEIGYIELSELEEIEGFDEDVAQELQNRARAWLDAQENALKDKQSELGIADDLIELEGLTANLALKLGEAGVKTRDDLADLAGDELVEMLGDEIINETDANALIMKAREHWFADEANDDNAETSEDSAAADDAEENAA
ncbi:MAG: transcription termination factor NusA [Pseudomonadota bacterium]|nr:transcription termination factor NusA [Alphaproteobacteria bacterium]MEC7702815.1 transcription termination factor NusA [Pseudomonadota bacterium]MEC9235400.1 transcription termination factor NusA [Pseudomonadota bacterium]